ncbi:hypothetical protein HK105_206096 [Polyrhizophydium stewartii]|uniref:Uncharacterized protein n=1 Tax=Polyrhizophydium stewartii TaxID=2732419 RepID=A0ABR4N4C4_9FUNG
MAEPKPPQPHELKFVVKGIKQQQQGHVAKLQLKSEAEHELLETVRDYMQKRAELEVQYSKSLERLSKTVQQRRFRKFLGPSPTPLSLASGSTPTAAGAAAAASASTPAPPAAADADGASQGHAADSSARDTYMALISLLAESERQAKARIHASERMVTAIADAIKDFNKERVSSTKRNLDYCIKYQQELWLAYEELDKLKLAYEKAAKDDEAAQKKYDDAAKRPKSGLQALKSLVTGKDAEERIQKLKSKWKTKTRKLNDARNEYLLCIAGTNAMHNHYYRDDMTVLMQKIDGDYYTTLSGLLRQYTQLEAALSQGLKASADKIESDVGRIARQRDVDLFLREHHGVFFEQPEFMFEPAPSDGAREMTVDEASRPPLGRRLGELVVRDEALAAMLAQREKELAGVIQMAETYAATPQFGNASSPLEQKQDIQNAIDLIKAQRLRTSTQIQAIRQHGIEPIMPALPEEHPPLPGASSKAASSATMAAPPSVTAASDHAAQGGDELTVAAGDALEIVAPDEGGRTRVRHVASGAVGFVPTAVVHVEETGRSASPTHGAGVNAAMLVYALQGEPAARVPRAMRSSADAGARTRTADYDATDEGELSFKSGDAIECIDGIYDDEEWWDGRLVRTGQTGTFQVALTKGWEAVAAASANKPKMARGASVRRAMGGTKRTASTSSGILLVSTGGPKVIRARALYSYEATCEGELTIDAGEIITVVSKETGSEAWWEGEGKSGRGQFPVNYVQVIDDEAPPTADISSIGKLGQLSEMPQVRALYDFSSTSPGELSFKAGDIIKVHQCTDPDWWDGDLNGQAGAFPANYVEKI